MPPRASMNQLIELAEKRVEQAANTLAARNARERDAEAKLQLLVNYRQDYFNRFGNAAAVGIDNHLLHNFRAFMEKLDTAIDEQHLVLAEARSSVRSAQLAWQAEQQRLKSFQVLVERRRGTERARDARREQREQDEHAAKFHVRNRASA